LLPVASSVTVSGASVPLMMISSVPEVPPESTTVTRAPPLLPPRLTM